MNWTCLIQAILSYFQCASGASTPAPRSKFTDCLITAAVAGLQAAIPAFVTCLANGGNGGNGGGGDQYNPGDRIRCPGPACTPQTTTG